jgi:ATP-binding cassette subfamily B protein
MFFVTLAPAIVSLKRINAVTNAKLEINDPAKPAHFKPSGDLEFRNVSFRYKNADSDVLHNISFKIKEGQTVAFIGATGCGKTSLMDLIPRFHDVTAGEILINGVNIKDIRQNDLRDAIGYVPQKSFLFAGTVAHNIKYGKNISDQRMLKAAQIACA